MANDPAAADANRKRTASQAGMGSATGAPSDAKIAKTREGTHIRHHQLNYKQLADADSWFVVTHDHEAMRQLLDRSIALALDAVGFEYAEPLALESFRALAEEYMSHFTHAIQTHMLGSRRRTPIAQDFLHALAAHNLTLRALLPHLDPPVVSPRTTRHPVLNSKHEIQPPLLRSDLAPAAATQTAGLEDPVQLRLIDVILGDAAVTERKPAYVPDGFPSFPSQHTYKARPVFETRERDPQAIRERATEQGRQGEEALRRLAGKTAGNGPRTKADGGSGSETIATTAGKRERKRSGEPPFREKAQEMWTALMERMATGTSQGPGDGGGANSVIAQGEGGTKRDFLDRLSGPVNSESRYWRRLQQKTSGNG